MKRYDFIELDRVKHAGKVLAAAALTIAACGGGDKQLKANCLDTKFAKANLEEKNPDAILKHSIESFVKTTTCQAIDVVDSKEREGIGSIFTESSSTKPGSSMHFSWLERTKNKKERPEDSYRLDVVGKRDPNNMSIVPDKVDKFGITYNSPNNVSYGFELSRREEDQTGWTMRVFSGGLQHTYDTNNYDMADTQSGMSADKLSPGAFARQASMAFVILKKLNNGELADRLAKNSP